MNTLWHDLRYAARMLIKRSSFTIVALLTLALGIGANTAIFSVVNAVLLRPLPYPESDRLVWMTETAGEIPTRWISYPNFLDWQARNRSFAAMATIRGWQMTMTGGGEAQSINARMVTADYFRVMRVQPIVGRDFSSEEVKWGAPGVTVLSYDFWQSQFGGDPDVAGKPITLNNQPFRVIGVMAQEFRHQGPPSLWVLTEQYAEPGSGWFTRDMRTAGLVVARLLPGVTIEQSRADMKSIEEELKPGELINVDWSIISPNYFRTMRIPIKEGRTFTTQEAEQGANVVLIDGQLARRFWPAGDAIGKHIKYDPNGPQEIIGIAGDVRNYGSEALGRIKFFTPFGRSPLPRSTLAVRITGTDPSLVASIKAEVQAINPNIPISEVDTLENLLARHIAPRRFNTWLLGLFAAVALLLATVGIYGVVSYTVTQLTREIGIRVALGAQRGDVMRLTFARSLRLVLVGLGLGLLASLAVTRSLKSLLFAVSATDPLTLILTALLLTAVAMLACWVPARRAAKVDPMTALRYE